MLSTSTRAVSLSTRKVWATPAGRRLLRPRPEREALLAGLHREPILDTM